MEPLASAAGSAPWAAMTVGILALRHNVVQAGLLERKTPRVVQRRVSTTVAVALDALERGFRPS